MKKYLLSLLSVLALAGCGEPETPEHFGIYARLTNGDLVNLDRIGDVQNTKMVFFGNSSSIQMSDAINAPRYNYILEKPVVTLNMEDVEGFIVFGEGEINDNVKIKYFADAQSFNGKFFDNNGKGGVNKTTHIDQGTSCGLADGVLNKKIAENMYLFTLPKAEKTDYKFCSLSTYKEMGKGSKKSPYVAVDFYAWSYNGVYWAFNVEGEDPKGKQKELERQEIIAKRIAAEKAEIQRKKDELRAFDKLPVVNHINDILTKEDFISLAAKDKSAHHDFKIKNGWVYLGAFQFKPSQKEMNDFQFQSLLDGFKDEINTIREEYKNKDVKGAHVRVIDINLPITLNVKGWVKASFKDVEREIASKLGYRKAKVSSVLKGLSQDMYSSMSNTNRVFYFGTYLDVNGYDEHRHNDLSFLIRDQVKEIGQVNGGKDIIEEVTLKYHDIYDDGRRNGKTVPFLISSFKLKSTEGRFVLTGYDRSSPYIYIPIDVKPKA